MKLESFSKIDNNFYIVTDTEAAEYIAELLYKYGLSQMNLLAARNRGKVIIDPEDVPEIQRINETMELMVTANKLKEKAKEILSEIDNKYFFEADTEAKKKASEEAL